MLNSISVLPFPSVLIPGFVSTIGNDGLLHLSTLFAFSPSTPFTLHIAILYSVACSIATKYLQNYFRN